MTAPTPDPQPIEAWMREAAKEIRAPHYLLHGPQWEEEWATIIARHAPATTAEGEKGETVEYVCGCKFSDYKNAPTLCPEHREPRMPEDPLARWLLTDDPQPAAPEQGEHRPIRAISNSSDPRQRDIENAYYHECDLEDERELNPPQPPAPPDLTARVEWMKRLLAQYPHELWLSKRGRDTIDGLIEDWESLQRRLIATLNDANKYIDEVHDLETQLASQRQRIEELGRETERLQGALITEINSHRRVERCETCNVYVSDWVEAQHYNGRICRPCEHVHSLKAEIEALHKKGTKDEKTKP